jgi:phage FluMu gp28-like protein
MREGERETALEDDEDTEKEIEIPIARNVPELASLYNPEKHGTLYLGYDVARKRDAAVIYVIGLKNDRKISLAEIEFRSAPFEEQYSAIRAIMYGLSPVRCCIDETGMGGPVCERLQKEFGEDRVEGIEFTPENKEILAVNVKRGLENREFLLPNTQAFHLQIHSIKRTSTLAGRFRYDAERDEKGHADSFWAWALACHAITMTASHSPNYWEQRARKKKEGMLQSDQKNPSHQPAPNLTTGRGKSLNAVLRGVSKNAHK